MNSYHSSSILPHSYYDSYYNMNDFFNRSDIFDTIDTSEFDYPINDLEKQLPEYTCSDNDYIEITVSDEESDYDEDNNHYYRDEYKLEPDIENAIQRQNIQHVQLGEEVRVNNQHHHNDYYNGIISYYMHICKMTYTILDFDFRD